MRAIRAVIITAILMFGFFVPADVSAEKMNETTKAETKKKAKKSTKAIVRKFDLYEHELLADYNAVYQMKRSNIKSITNNGGNYSGSPIKNAMDGDLTTHWETGRANNDSFTNEVEFTLKEAETLNRIVYAARQDGAKGKGFAKEFTIYGSTEKKGDNYELVSSGTYEGSTGDMIEIQFKPTKFKRVKFVFNKADQNWASAAEFQFYKEDPVSDQMHKLFTDDRFSEVSKEFASEEVLKELEKEAKGHPLYSLFQEEIEDAQAILHDKGIEPVTAETIPFGYFPNEKYSKAFQMSHDNIKSIRNNAGHYASAVIENAIDNDLTTYWETNTGNSKDFTNEVEIEFKKAVELNRLVYGARKSDNKGFAQGYEIYISKTSKGDTYQKLATGKHETVGGLVEAKFEPTTFKRVKFKFTKSNQNWATLSEMLFYKEDKIADKVDNLFIDGLMNELKPEFASKEELDALENEIKEHPIKKELQDKIDIARNILSGEDNKEQAIVTASQRGDAWATAGVKQIPRTSFSLDTFGRYVTPGETIRVFVDADPNGIMPKLVFGQIADNKDSWIWRYPLKPGLNTITAPSAEKIDPAIIYIENSALPSDQAYAPKVRLEGGTDFPVYYHGKTDPAQFRKDLEAYVKNISIDDKDFANGKPKDKVYNVAELVSENNTISTSAAGALQGLKEIDALNKDASDTMDEWEIMWEEFQKISGNVKDDEDPKQQYFPAKFTSRVFTNGPYGWSAGGYTGYNGGDTPRRDSGFFKQIVKPISAPGNDDWAYFHEWGHNINNQQIEHLEVTNNIYAVIMREILLNNYDDRADWNNLYKRFQGEEVKHGYFTYLGILLQLEYYYEGSYGLASRVARENPDGVLNDLDNTLQKMVIAYSLGLEKDLTRFFDEWGYVKATDKMKEKVAHLPKLDVKLEYMHSSGRNYDGKGFTKDSKLTIDALQTNKEKKETSLAYSVDKASTEAAMGYEIIRDDEVIAYTTSTTFVDKGIDPNKEYLYQVVAYDKLLKPLEPLEVQSKQPTLSVEEFVTLKLHQKFDPLSSAKAVTHAGEDITKKIRIKSNNVDVTKKGNYQIVYEVKDEGTTITRTSNITVTSDYTYLSDLQEESFNIAWGGLQKDLAPSGNAITLIRQGLDARYAKGLGVHANSEVVYDVTEGQFDYFESYIGIDQAVKGGNSSATFEVWVDDKKKYSSKVFSSNTEHEFIRVPITGAKQVKLITTDAKINGNTADHTVWAAAKFTKDSSGPNLTVPGDIATKVGNPIDLDQPYKATDPEDGDITDRVKVKGIDKVDFDKVGKYTITYSVTDSDGNTTVEKRIISVVDMDDFAYLSDYDWSHTENSYVAPTKDLSTSSNALRLTDKDGKEVQYAKGFGAHSTSTIVYDLRDLNVAYVTSFVGVDRQMFNTAGSVVFKVYVDGKEKFDSGLMNSTTPQKYFEVDVSGAKELKLVVTDGGNGNGSDHATWGDTKIYFAGESQFSTEVDPIDTNSEVVTGRTKPNTMVTVKDEDGKDLGEIQADENGAFAVNIPKQAANTKITVIVRDKEGKELDTVTVKVEQAKINTRVLEDLIKEAKEYQEEAYTASTFEALIKSISEAEKVVEKATEQEEVEEAIKQLQEAIDGLEKEKEPELELDTAKLEKLIEEAKEYEQDVYTEASFNKLQASITEAEAILKNAEEQNEIDEAIKQLQESMDHLEKVEIEPEPEPEPELDTAELERLIEHAKVYEKADYTEATFNRLQEAIAAAESVVGNATTQVEIEKATTKLKEGISGLDKMPEPESEPELDTTALEQLIKHAKVYEPERYTEATFNHLQENIKYAETVVNNATIQEEVEEARTALKAAIQGLERVPTPEPEPELDTAALKQLIGHAKLYKKEAYTEATFNQLQQVMNEAEQVTNNATSQEEIDHTIIKLKQAIDALERIIDPNPDPEDGIDTTELAELIAYAKTYEQENYTESSYASLQSAIQASESVINNATKQEEIDTSIKQLRAALVGLEVKPTPEPDPEPEIDTDELRRLIVFAKEYKQDHYTEGTYANLQKAISTSESVVNNATTQEEVEAAIKQLQEALVGMEVKPTPEPEPKPEINTSELQDLIDHAKEYGQEGYTESSYTTLQSAISASEKVVNNATSQEEVAASMKQLQEALLGLEKEVAKPEKPEINTDELAKLIERAKAHKEEDYTEASFTALQNVMKDAESVIDTATTQEEVEVSIQKLEAAIAGLMERPVEPEPSPDPEPEPEPDPEPSPDPKPEPEPGPELNPEPKPDPNPEPEPSPETKPESKPEPGPAPSPKPQPEIETNELSELIDKAKMYDKTKYTNDSYTALQGAIKYAELVVKNAKMQEEVNGSLKQLEESIANLIEITESTPNPAPGFEKEPGSGAKSDPVEIPESETNRLPNTATQLYNSVLLGFVLVSLGLMFLIRGRKLPN